jgi:hypothetical protein
MKLYKKSKLLSNVEYLKRINVICMDVHDKINGKTMKEEYCNN